MVYRLEYSRRSPRAGTVTRVPKVPRSKMWDEDSTIKRVCCARSIQGCLRGLQASVGVVYNVLRLIDETEYNLYRPTNVQVLDASITGEYWILEKCEFEVMGSLSVTKVKYDSNKRRRTYIFKWIKKIEIS